MRGWLARRHADYELATYTAWRTEAFAREDKLKPLSQYLKAEKRAAKAADRQSDAEKLTAFRALAAAGAPIKIEVVDAPPRRRTE